MNSNSLGRPILLGPDTKVVDALVFGPAPDTQALSELGHKQRKLELLNGTTKYYERFDYILDRDSEGFITSITTLVDGALDAGGPANATYTAASFDSDDTTEEHRVARGGFRVTIDGSLGAGGATVQVKGKSHGNAGFYDLGASFVVAPGDIRTIFFDEPTDIAVVELTAVAGVVEVYIQDLG